MKNDRSPKARTTVHSVLLVIMLFAAMPSVAYSDGIANKNVATGARTLKDVLGNWVNVENGVWVYGFYPTFAVVEGAFWDYEKVTSRKGKLQIQLRRGGTTKTIYAVPGKGLLKVGANEKQMTAYSQQGPSNPDFKNYDLVGFKSPLIRQDSFKLSGILEGYDRKKDDFKYVQVIYDPIMEDDQANFVAALDSLGRFSLTFPLLNPQEIMFAFGNAMTGFYAAPGSNVMVSINKAHFEKVKSLDDFITFIKTKPELLFMGDEAMLNTEINYYTPVNFGVLSPVESQQQTEKLGVAAYQSFRLGKMEEQFATLEKYSSSHRNGKKFLEHMRASTRYSAAEDLLRYRWLRDTTLNQEQLSFLHSVSWTHEQDVSTREYFAFIREYLVLLSTQKKKTTSGDSEMISFEEVLEKAITASDEMSAADIVVLQQLVQLQKTAHLAETQKKLSKDSVVFKTVIAKYQNLLQEAAEEIASERSNNTATNLQAYVVDSLPRGIGRDIMLGRMAGQHLAQQRPLTAGELSVYQAAIQTPALYADITRRNTELTNKLEGSAPQNAEILSPISESAKNVLESLTSKYKGNVIYVDFWAPWCGPCMSEMPQAKILRQELAGKKVTFLYLCVNCSEESWTNAIKAKEIGGQHYRLSNDEYSVLSSRFKITGIPQHVLINKDGAVVDEDATSPSDKNALIRQIEELLD